LHPNNPHLRALELDPQLRRFVVISDMLGQDYLKIYPSLLPKISVHHDGADPAASPRGTVPPALIPMQSGKLNAAYIGNLYPGKGMEMIARLLPLAPFCHFHILGGQDTDLKRWKASCEGASNISFYGYRSPADVEILRTSFDCLLAPFQSRVMVGPDTDASRWMSPLKIFEYMAAGRPIIASNLPVIREVLRDGVNALLCSPDDPQEWLNALRTLHENPETGTRIAIASKRDLNMRYTWRTRAEKILEGCQIV
jgi:glycosyltransferase involved in cell wall biosynthesis